MLRWQYFSQVAQSLLGKRSSFRGARSVTQKIRKVGAGKGH